MRQEEEWSQCLDSRVGALWIEWLCPSPILLVVGTLSCTTSLPTPNIEAYATRVVSRYTTTIKLVGGFVAAPIFSGLLLRQTSTTPTATRTLIMSSSTPPQLFINGQWRDAR